MGLKRRIGIFLIMSLAGIAFLTYSAPANAEEELHDCQIEDDQIKTAAQKASSALKQCATLRTQYTNNLNTTLKNSDAPCNQYVHWYYIDGGATFEWSWGDYDQKGVRQDPEPEKNQLASLFAAVQEFPDTDWDIGRYIVKNNTQKNEFTALLAEAENLQDEKVIPEIKKELAAIEKCDTALKNLKASRQHLLDARVEAHTFLTLISKEAVSSCKCSEDGTLNECTVIDDTFTEDHVDDSSCKTLADYVAELSICPTCGLFETILIAVQKISKGAFEALNEALIKLLGLAFAIFAAYETLKAVSSPATQKLSKYLTTLTAQGFKVSIAVLLLLNPDFLYGTLITPIIESGLEFGLELLGDSKGLISQFAVKYTSFDNSNTYLTSDFLQKVVGAAEAFNSMAATMPAMGRGMICVSWTDLNYYVIPHIALLVEGTIIYIFGMGICLAIGFYLLDCAVQLGIMCALMPFFVACWPFKLTFRYTKTGWSWVMNTFFNFVMMGVVITTANNITLQAISSGLSQEELSDFINTNNVKALEEAIDFGGMQMLTLVVCCMIISKLIEDVGSLANKFEGGAGIAMGAKLGGVAASAATTVGKSALKTGGKVAGNVGGAIAEASGAKGAAQALGGKMKSLGNKALGKLGMGSQAQLGAKGRDTGGGGGGGSAGGGAGGNAGGTGGGAGGSAGGGAGG